MVELIFSLLIAFLRWLSTIFVNILKEPNASVAKKWSLKGYWICWISVPITAPPLIRITRVTLSNIPDTLPLQPPLETVWTRPGTERKLIHLMSEIAQVGKCQKLPWLESVRIKNGEVLGVPMRFQCSVPNPLNLPIPGPQSECPVLTIYKSDTSQSEKFLTLFNLRNFWHISVSDVFQS